MNGYRDRVERHRRRLAEAASRGERTAVPGFDWLVATIQGAADAAHMPKGAGAESGDRDR
jgi:hypothetical protein